MCLEHVFAELLEDKELVLVSRPQLVAICANSKGTTVRVLVKWGLARSLQWLCTQAAVGSSGLALQFVPESLKSDEEVVWCAVSQDRPETFAVPQAKDNKSIDPRAKLLSMASWI